MKFNKKCDEELFGQTIAPKCKLLGIGGHFPKILVLKPDTLYISDLDGTLLGNDAALSDFSRRLLRKMLSKGLLFTVASARSVVSIRAMLHGLELPLPVIELNGAFVSDLPTGRHEIVNHLQPDILEELYSTIRTANCVPLISTFNGNSDCSYYSTPMNAGMCWYREDRVRHNDKRWHHVDDLEVAFKEKVVYIALIDQAKPLQDLEQEICRKYGDVVETHFYENPYQRGWYWLTIHDYKATKDQALRKLVEAHGLHSRELVVFGDQANDSRMFKLAHRAVAVSNAIPELKELATHCIGSNEEDSVVKFILED